MRKVAIVFGILAGAALAFVLCGGMEVAGRISAAMNAEPRTAAQIVADAQ